MNFNKEKYPPVEDPFKAEPTNTHYAIVSLMEKQLIKAWVTTSPDPLPFLAGCKRGALNQLHGSLNDRDNVFLEDTEKVNSWQQYWLAELCETADMVIALGTRFKDINLARLGQSVAIRALDHDQQIADSQVVEQHSEGLVIVDPQPTMYDEMCQIRIWDDPDTVMEKICKELKIPLKKEP